MMDLDLRQVRSFMDVADLGSFSAAADKAGVTQPAISLHIRLLEKQLGVRLIERVGRRAQPTAAGRALGGGQVVGARHRVATSGSSTNPQDDLLPYSPRNYYSSDTDDGERRKRSATPSAKRAKWA